MGEVYRQGDVLIVPVDSIPAGCKPVKRDNGRVILAYGEVTGHAHAILDEGVSQIELKEGERYLNAPDGATITHEEHGTIVLPEGVFLIQRQKEYSPEEVRNVAD